jgi:uncharacterized protein (DUF427 family)
VWDYPRPPRVEPLDRHVRVVLGGVTIAESDRALRVLETSSPPTVYVPREDVRTDLLTDAPERHTICEWKGRASYLHAEAGGQRAEHVAWHYPEPKEGYEQLAGHLAFYARRHTGSSSPHHNTGRSWRSALESHPRIYAAYLDDELVTSQGGDYYGGWITEEIEGPFKGDPGSEGW